MLKLINRWKLALWKSKRTYHTTLELLTKKRNKISVSQANQITELLRELDKAIANNDNQKAYDLSMLCKEDTKAYLAKNTFDYFNEWVLGLGFIILTVAFINQIAFQLYQIPSGSMRPTLMEKDRLIATKTSFGINFPFKGSHIYFNPKLLDRGDIVIFTNDNLPPEENKSRYLFLIPVKKQMVKRMIGRPGDTLYFYGGKIFGIDENDKPIAQFQNQTFEKLEHIPFINFEGKVISDPSSIHKHMVGQVYLYQMNQAVAKLNINPNGLASGKLSNGIAWIDESPSLGYQDLWGMKNYAMVRIMDKSQAKKLGYNVTSQNEEFFLEMHHSPQTKHPRPYVGMDLQGRVRPKLSLERTFIPLSKEHLTKIKQALSTARFTVKDTKVGNYSMERAFKPHSLSPSLEGVEDGTYEFTHGIAYKVNLLGEAKALSASHPLNSEDGKMIQKLFNYGPYFAKLFDPEPSYKDFMPNRYGYFKDQDLYLLNQPIFLKDDQVLAQFNENETQKTRPFIDHGAPFKNGEIDLDLIKNYGLKIPPNKYLLLGDNHAGSRDCRDFGFIDQEHIQGSPSLIFWPLSSRSGLVNKDYINKVNSPTIIVFGLGSIVLMALYTRSKRQKRAQHKTN